ncbi:hypothetical protein [Priestia taiwanensis]|uniref:Holin n=1 Tax=Priestia taiwanensis TaxID=1347902 RepID=A0A917AKA0_9BACI|nr:hypothetical protein [Priestia taiwanensis]MBM7362005.1 putative membrane protein [Priestia taiwanensis]GGE58677.1 hypothetical protein GCM10007140_06300 [Priestia taiwanensis]
MREKLRNKGLWLALFALLGMILMDTVPNFDAGRYEQYVDVILMILVGAGVISNPNAGKWFVDTESENKNDGGTK